MPTTPTNATEGTNSKSIVIYMSITNTPTNPIKLTVQTVYIFNINKYFLNLLNIQNIYAKKIFFKNRTHTYYVK